MSILSVHRFQVHLLDLAVARAAKTAVEAAHVAANFDNFNPPLEFFTLNSVKNFAIFEGIWMSSLQKNGFVIRKITIKYQRVSKVTQNMLPGTFPDLSFNYRQLLIPTYREIPVYLHLDLYRLFHMYLDRRSAFENMGKNSQFKC